MGLSDAPDGLFFTAAIGLNEVWHDNRRFTGRACKPSSPGKAFKALHFRRARYKHEIGDLNGGWGFGAATRWGIDHYQVTVGRLRVARSVTDADRVSGQKRVSAVP